MTDLTTTELLDLRSVLERSLQREQRRIADHAATLTEEHHANKLAEAIGEINVELNGRLADRMGAGV